MNIFDHAIRFEREGVVLYSRLAKKTRDGGLRNIFKWLADQEERHREIIVKLKAGRPVSGRGRVNFKRIKGIFKKMKRHVEEMEARPSAVAAYKAALVVEKRSMVFYGTRARATKVAEEREILQMLAGEERKHMVVLENLLEFMDEPSEWAEDAEFVKLDRGE